MTLTSTATATATATGALTTAATAVKIASPGTAVGPAPNNQQKSLLPVPSTTRCLAISYYAAHAPKCAQISGREKPAQSPGRSCRTEPGDGQTIGQMYRYRDMWIEIANYCRELVGIHGLFIPFYSSLCIHNCAACRCSRWPLVNSDRRRWPISSQASTNLVYEQMNCRAFLFFLVLIQSLVC